MIKFKNNDNKEESTQIIDVQSTLKVYFIPCRKKCTVYFIAAHTIDDALELFTEFISDIKWVEKTRDDYNREDYWQAWVDHNRDKEYKKYLKAINREKNEFISSIEEIDGPLYIGKPCILKEISIRMY